MSEHRAAHRKARTLNAPTRLLAYGTLAAGAAAVMGGQFAQAAQHDSAPGASPGLQDQPQLPATAHHLSDEFVPHSTAHALGEVALRPAPRDTRPAAATASVQPSPHTYTVRPGDTLTTIAQSSLGSADRYMEIFDLNKNRSEPDATRFTDPGLIYPGWQLTLPNGARDAAPATAVSHTLRDTSAQASPSGSVEGSLSDWISAARTILQQHGISVSYDAIYETAMHESSGNPGAVNRTDSNAAAGHPSIGLMQMVQSTFDAYALPGYEDIYRPVDNIIAAVRYADEQYGSLDNVVAARCNGNCWSGY